MKKRNHINMPFKPSKSNSAAWNFSKTMIQTALFWFVFLYLIPKGIVLIEVDKNIAGFQQMDVLGWILFLLFGCVGLYSGYTMSQKGEGTPLPIDCPNKLVVQGPYQFVRNPMAITGIGQGISVGLMLGSYLVILYALMGAIFWHLFVRPIEEKDLEARFGKPYLAYKKKIRCWIPTFKQKKEET